MNFRDAELLSAYLDGRLSPSEAARLEARLSTDKNLKTTLEGLRETRALLRQLPRRRAPRNFRLTPQMAGIRPPAPRAYPVFRLATALVALLFVVAVGLNAFVPFAATSLTAAPAPQGFGMGGGGGPSESQPSAATEAPLEAPFAAQIAPTATPEGTLSGAEATAAPPQAEDTLRAQATEQVAGKASPVQPPVAPRAGVFQPVPVGLIVALGVLMLLCAVVAWLLRSNSDRRIRSRWNHK